MNSDGTKTKIRAIYDDYSDEDEQDTEEENIDIVIESVNDHENQKTTKVVTARPKLTPFSVLATKKPTNIAKTQTQKITPSEQQEVLESLKKLLSNLKA